MSTLPKNLITPEQYLELERAAEFRHEYYDGEIFAMSGAREAHNLIAVNLAAALMPQLRPKGCRVFVTDLRVKVGSGRAYTYPDLAVACGERLFLDATRDTLLSPTLIVEVLSPSTERHDRSKKFLHYKTIESLQQYILVAADAPCVDVFTRAVDGEWKWRNVYGLEDTLELESIGCRLKLAEVYEDIEFDTATSAG
jgi:Uma2 family endonuclease